MRFVPVSGFITLLRSRDVAISHYDGSSIPDTKIEKENKIIAIFYKFAL